MPIYDQSFRRYEGPRSTSALWRVVAWQTLRPILRSKLAALLLVGVIMLVTFYSVVMYLGATTLKTLPPGHAEQAASAALQQGIPMFGKLSLNTMLWQFVLAVSGIVWLLVLITGGGVVSSDLRNAALPLYFSRPLKPRDYVLGKVFGLAIAPLVVIYVALLLIYLQATALYYEAADVFRQAHLLFYSLVYATVTSLIVSLLMVAFSSASRKAATAAVSFFGFYTITFVAAQIVERGFRYRQAATLSPARDFQILAYWLFHPDLERVRQQIRFDQYDVRIAALALVLYCAIALIVIRRNLKVVEVVK